MLYDRFREACEKRGTTITQVLRDIGVQREIQGAGKPENPLNWRLLWKWLSTLT